VEARRTLRISVVTTMHAKAYEAYGIRMIESFLKNWPEQVEFYLYTEGFSVEDIKHDRLKVVDLHAAAPDLVAFKTQHKNNPAAHGRQDRGPVQGNPRARIGLGYRWDAVRFSNKSFAWCHAVRKLNHDRIIWLDADTITHSSIPMEFLVNIIPDHSLCGYLGRNMMYTETGFIIVNSMHFASSALTSGIEFIYKSGKIFDLPEWHDCEVFDTMRRFLEGKGVSFVNISGNAASSMHPFINSELGRYMDHMKGDRKKIGRSKKEDLTIIRSEDYWKQ
jgi:hypothetical protein